MVGSDRTSRVLDAGSGRGDESLMVSTILKPLSAPTSALRLPVDQNQ